MLPELIQGTFLWYWGNSWAPLHGMALSIIAATLAVFMTRWTHKRNWVKLPIVAGMLATVPLGIAKLGFEIPVYDQNTLTYFNFFGTVLAIAVAVPYLFHQTLRAAAGKYSTYVGHTIKVPSMNANRKEEGVKEESTPETNLTEQRVTGNTINFQTGPRAGDTMNVNQKTLTIGRSPDNDIVIDDPTVSRTHARITFDGNQYHVEDLKSTSGTQVNGEQVDHMAIMPGATMKMGNSEFVLNNPLTSQYNAEFVIPSTQKVEMGQTRNINQVPLRFSWLVGTAGSGIGDSSRLKEGENILGRDATNDVVVNDQYTSRQHAMVKIHGDEAHVFDLGSVGGTKVNGQEIGGGALGLNSVIKMGETELTLLQVDNPRQFAQGMSGSDTLIDNRGEKVPALLVTSGIDSGKSYILREGDNAIGRGDEFHIALSDDSISRSHAVVRCQNGKMTLLDVGSRSGTELNGQKLSGHSLSNGDVISIGRSEFTMMAPKTQTVTA